MPPDILAEAHRLREAGRPFALATVVAVRQPTSGVAGARAIITADSRIEGWIGGQCVQPIVLRQAREALADGRPRLVEIKSDLPLDAPEREGVVSVAMTCAGQGEVQIFVEPFLPAAQVVIFGTSPVARTIAGLASLLDFEVWACDPEVNGETFPSADRLLTDLEALKPELTTRSYVVVATFGLYDEAAIRIALESPASYVGLVASRKRLAAVRESLRQDGVPDELLQRLRRSEGLLSATRLPAEIALSVVTDLVDARRQRVGQSLEPPRQPNEAIDPICGMTVDVPTARYKAVRDGHTYYFCCRGCEKQFAERKR